MRALRVIERSWMRVQTITRVSLPSFREKSAGRKIVLLYPWTNYRNLFLTHFLSSAKDGLLYYRIPTEVSSITDWMRGLAEEFNTVLGGFGSHLSELLQRETPPVDMLGEALAQDLGEYSKEPIVLFIDELDRMPLDNNFRKFINALVSSLPEHVQIAFSSRLLTYQPWYDMVSKGDAVVLGTEYRKDDMMFTVEERPKPQLEVYALGRGYALVNGQQITNWDGALPRNLFFYFVDHPLVTRDEIFKTFWPDLTVKEATNVFHVTKRKISERISMKVGESGSYELTQYVGGFYIPSEKIVRHYDAGDFQESVERALMTLDEREEELLLTRAIDLYKAPFLQTIEMPWTIERRHQLRQLYSQALISMGRIAKKRDVSQSALGYFTRALKETPEREDIHREVMALYLKLNMIEDARVQYRRLEQILADTVNIGPSRETRDLYGIIESRS
jgi:two-component SAPR family response regulator